MEESSSQHKAQLWDGDAKAVQQCLTDIFTSVYTTCDVPESAIFGPCVLSHTSMYDSIAFIALKATDKRTAPYIFRVDTSAANSTSEGLMWLRLVQSARDKDEQNLEAYVKNGQLFYRSLRRIEKDEELLVWYGKDLVELLLLTAARVPAKSKGSSHHSCPDCSQRFQFEFPFLAHLRFRCTKRLQSLTGADEEPGRERSPERQNTPPRLYQADPLAAKLQGAELGANCPVPGGVAKQSPFVYAAAAAAATFWPKNSGGVQLQMPSALTLLPPSFTSLCLPAQNWCAKCNASFRMTSDLVYHMRSHHKKEYAMEPLVKRRREEKLKCPICNESFRERHHLSRHMTSHN
ncbi:PR domain zinc finger protein 8b [Hippocampus comes]|uniref:PR domain zinc finger protein 8b n=1 Tax=Hippocampus comes TaxID=109280 RepID=UPI00094E190D|nr:PREDICTED: PR domain zinc finger protein 8 [Hippocampus comes]